jgi:OPA family sugar phosphate sensor protein UhpC-like MFS transporter
MIEFLFGFYAKSVSVAARDPADAAVQRELRRRKWSVFLSITLGYGFYYVCRLSFSVAKKSMADEGLFDAAELGLIGSALFFAYAFGKLANGVLADRVNTRKFMATGLFVSAAINLTLGFSTSFWVFMILWAMNGWFQSFGAGSSVVTITHWYDGKERGTFYGMWASSHNIGEAITFVGTAIVVSAFGWMWGFRVAGVLCMIMSIFIWRYLYERPEVYGLPSAIREPVGSSHKLSISQKQWAVFTNPAVWVLAFSSAFFYVTRYAINSWGIFFLEAEKGYTTIEAGSIVSANALAGILSTFFSGILSDRLFGGRRNFPALIFGIIYLFATAWFVLGPANAYADTASMVLFGIGVGALMVYLGGLMAVDICSKDASGTALGVIGVASYLGAGLQDIISGWLIDDAKTIVNGVTYYNFDAAGMMWIGSALVSLVLAMFVWNAKSPD